MTSIIQKIVRRNESALNIQTFEKITKQDSQKIATDLKIQKAGNLAFKIIGITVCFALYKRHFFDKSSKYFWKENSLVVSLISGDFLVKSMLSDWFWNRNKHLILKYARMKEADFFQLSLKAKDLYKSDSDSESLY